MRVKHITCARTTWRPECGHSASVRFGSFVLTDPLPQISAYPELEFAFILAAAALIASALFVFPRSTVLLEFGVGAAAAFDFAQIANVHIFTIVCFLYLLFGEDRRNNAPATFAAIALVSCAAVLGVTVLTGDLVNSRTLGVQLVLLATSGAIVASRADQEACLRMAYGLFAVCAIGAAIGLGQRTGVIPYTHFTDPNQLGRVRGIWREPDWFGMFAAVGLVLSFRLPMRFSLQAFTTLVLTAAVVLSLARAAWIALAVVALVSLARAYRRADTAKRWQNRAVLASALIGGALFLSQNADVRQYAAARAGALVGIRQQDTGLQARQAQTNALLDLAASAPWYGHGLSTAGRVTVDGRIDYGSAINNVATNWVLGWWIDGKLLAIPLIALLALSAVRFIGTAGGAVLTLVLVASLASNAMLMPIAWLAFGLGAAEAAENARRRRTGRRVQSSQRSRRPGRPNTADRIQPKSRV